MGHPDDDRYTAPAGPHKYAIHPGTGATWCERHRRPPATFHCDECFREGQEALRALATAKKALDATRGPGANGGRESLVAGIAGVMGGKVWREGTAGEIADAIMVAFPVPAPR